MEDDFFDFVDEFKSTLDRSGELVCDDLFDEQESLEGQFIDDKARDVALFRRDLIRYLEKRLSGGWTPKNLNPLLQEFADSQNSTVPSARTVADWKKDYYESGKRLSSLTPLHHKKGCRQKDHPTDELIKEAIDSKYLTKERFSVNTAYDYYKNRVTEVNQSNIAQKLRAISQRTFYNRINNLEPYKVDLARYGKRYADSKYKQVGSNIPATRPMEYVEIDHTTAPVVLLDDELEIPLGRPHLTILYDRYSACIVGLSVNYRNPSYETVRAAFINAVLKKDWVKSRYPDVKEKWPCHGNISYLIVDNGAEFWSDSLESALKPLVTDILYNQRGKPWRKAGVEKSFDTFYKKLFSRFPGKTFTNPTQLYDYNPKRDAVVTVSTFLSLLHKWLIDVYHQKADTRYQRIPYQKWLESQDKVTYCEGLEAEQLKIELGIVKERTLSRGAVQVHSLRYQSDELEAYGKRYPSRTSDSLKVITKTDPNDIGSIYVFLKEEQRYIKVPAVDLDGYTKGRSLYEHDRIRAAKRKKVQMGENEVSLAVASLEIDRAMDRAIDKMSRTGSNNKTLPKSVHASKIAKQRGVGSEGGGTIVVEPKEHKGTNVRSVNETEIINDDLSDIEGY
ncbi:Mu transposase C-terminal domain-containing protein [Vibrio mediterranei]|uniref:Mu transposase C-terminal domain-containing protein n=1 Tax=Vibrio mediterranei TaxID=689 RepID=UPI0017A73F27|nr:Mu transposase C-terminal domain-containing protein [Vibrio mediterranei]NUW71697.1 Mu transposase C-terminal domain-containing protein [Vibrio mediterranei]